VISYNNAAVTEYISRYAGFQALLSNAIKDPVEAIHVYRNKDVVEKCFDDLKTRVQVRNATKNSVKY
jgi:transposase